MLPPNTAGPEQGRVLFAGIFAIALATLLLEVSLTRVLSFTIWYHFAYVIISTSLLGFGAAGTLVAIAPRIGTRDLRSTLAACAVASAVSCVASLGFFALVPLDPMAILRSGSQFSAFLLYLVVSSVPFFFSGLVISLALREAAERVDRLYFWDLLGAGLGCAGAVGIMNRLTPPGAMVIASAVFAAAAAVFAHRAWWRATATLLGMVLAVAAPAANRVPLTPAPSKEISGHVRIWGGQPRITYWSALFRTDLVESMRPQEATTNCAEWGVSPLAPPCMAPRYLVHHDGTAGTGVYDLRDGQGVPHFQFQVLSIPYVVANPNPRVLVIGVGGGRDVIIAHQFGASHVTGVELDPMTIRIISDDVNETEGGFFRQPKVRLIASEGRHFVESTTERFDVIQLTGVDTLAAEFSGAYVLSESYLYTVEAIDAYLDRLKPGGILSFGIGDLNTADPRGSGRLLSTAQQALRRRGITQPQDHIVVVDSTRLFVEILIRAEPFQPEQLDKLSEHSKRLGFRVRLLGGRQSDPLYRALASAQGADLQRVLDSAHHVLSPVSDDQPFFFTFYRWNALLSQEQLRASGFSALGQVVLLLLLVSLTVLGGLFILGPLLAFQRQGTSAGGADVIAVLIYFLSIGLGFMLFEISLVQRFVLFLGYPTYSLSVTLFSLLVSLGLGSYMSRRWLGHERSALPIGVVALCAMAAFYLVGLPPIQKSLLATPLVVRIGVTTAVLMPLGIIMGMFFPLGIRHAAAVDENLVPWAWGVNGCASVTGAVLAVVLAMNFGIARVWMLSVAVYAVGVGAFLLLKTQGSGIDGPRHPSPSN